MKVFYNCTCCYQKIDLAVKVKTRKDLLDQFGRNYFIHCPNCHFQNSANINSIMAEISNINAPISRAIGGGLIGALAGPLGIIIGTASGRAIGGVLRSNDRHAVDNFNSQYL